jgi:nickel-type superoxide dismutase maturation protease
MNKLPKVGLIETALLLFDFRTRYRVEGDSMMPLLKHGDQVTVDESAELDAGDIVIARHPFIKGVEMVKRIKEIDENGKYFLVGDNPDESTDSRTFGAISVECIKGKVVSRLH